MTSVGFCCQPVWAWAARGSVQHSSFAHSFIRTTSGGGGHTPMREGGGADPQPRPRPPSLTPNPPPRAFPGPHPECPQPPSGSTLTDPNQRRRPRSRRGGGGWRGGTRASGWDGCNQKGREFGKPVMATDLLGGAAQTRTPNPTLSEVNKNICDERNRSPQPKKFQPRPSLSPNPSRDVSRPQPHSDPNPKSPGGNDQAQEKGKLVSGSATPIPTLTRPLPSGLPWTVTPRVPGAIPISSGWGGQGIGRGQQQRGQECADRDGQGFVVGEGAAQTRPLTLNPTIFMIKNVAFFGVSNLARKRIGKAPWES